MSAKRNAGSGLVDGAGPQRGNHCRHSLTERCRNNHQYQLTPNRMGRADGTCGACRRRRWIRVRARRQCLRAVILCVSVLMSLVRPARPAGARLFPPPTWSDRLTDALSTAGHRRSITTYPRRGGGGGGVPARSPQPSVFQRTIARPTGGRRLLSPTGAR